MLRPEDACPKRLSWFFRLFLLDSKNAEVCTSKSYRSRQELSHEYLLAEFGVDTAENGPLAVCQKLRKSIRTNIGIGVEPQPLHGVASERRAD